MRSFQEVSIKSIRDYWDARPCNINHSQKPVGEHEYYLEVRQRKYFVEPHIPDFANFSAWSGKRVLEVGCGIGTASLCFAEAGAEVTAVDLSPRSLEVARQGARALGLEDRIKLIQCNAEKLSTSLPQGSFDLVYSFGVLHHTPNPDIALTEIRKLVKPDGVLKLMVYYRYSWKVFWILVGYGKGKFWEADELVARFSEAQTGCPVTYTFTRSSARAWVEHHGFTIEDIFVDHIFPYRIPDYIEYRYMKNWYFRWLPKSVFHVFEKIFGWHLMITLKTTPEANVK